MPKGRRSKPKEKQTQHDKFVALARAGGADESESAFVDKLRQISQTAEIRRDRKMVKKSAQDMCPICTQPFNGGDVLVEYQTWDQNGERLAHVDCLLHLSAGEKRKHPPKPKG